MIFILKNAKMEEQNFSLTMQTKYAFECNILCAFEYWLWLSIRLCIEVSITPLFPYLSSWWMIIKKETINYANTFANSELITTEVNHTK